MPPVSCRLHLLGLAKLFLGLKTLGDLLRHPLFKGRVQRLQLGFRLPPLGELALCGLEKARIVDRGGGMSGYPKQRRFVLHLEFPGLGMAEEKSAKDLSGARDHGDSQVRADRQMALGHAPFRGVFFP